MCTRLPKCLERELTPATQSLEDELAQWCEDNGVDYLTPEMVDISEWDYAIASSDDALTIGTLMLQKRWLCDWIGRYERRHADENMQ